MFVEKVAKYTILMAEDEILILRVRRWDLLTVNAKSYKVFDAWED